MAYVFLRLDFSHLNEHKVCHTFKDGPNSTPDCSSATETTVQFFLQLQQYQSIRWELLNSTLISKWWIYLLVNIYTCYCMAQNYSIQKYRINGRVYSRNKRQHPVGFKRTLFFQATMVGLQKENFALKMLSDGRKQHPKTGTCLFLLILYDLNNSTLVCEKHKRTLLNLWFNC